MTLERCNSCNGLRKDCKYKCPDCGYISKVTNVCRPTPESSIRLGYEDLKKHKEAKNMKCIKHNCNWC